MKTSTTSTPTATRAVRLCCAIVVASCVAHPAASEEVRVLTSGAFAAALAELGPQYHRAANVDVVIAEGGTLGNGPDSIPSRLRRGDAVDVLIMSATALDDLVTAGKVVPGSRVDLAQSGIGMAVKAGAPVPDIRTVDALKRVLLGARSIAVSSSISGVYLTNELFPKLGIADRIADKIKRVETGRVGTVVARGDADIGFQQKSELATLPGIEYVGPLPAEVQRTTVFAAAIVAHSANAEGARRLIQFLAGPAARATIRKSGLDDVAAPAAGLAASVDALAGAAVASGKVAGMSVAVTRNGRTLISKAYGLADIELDVPTPAGASYEIGSVTKQFTAAAILLLAERGRLAIDDEITRHLPGYPTHGKRITIRHLLTHTSGIKGYTELPEFSEWSVQKKSRESFVPVFADKPLDFDPGDALVYNNSGYFLLGLIIEKVSGSPYADFIEKELFAPVGMKSSYYCSERAIHRNHAHGYDTADGHLVLKAYLDHTWPFAAGSLCSTADDLALWMNALHGGRVLKPESYRAMTTPAVLNDGSKTRYGFGLGISDVHGRRVIAHGGGINGFLSETEYYPDAGLAIVVLQNTAGPAGPTETARAIAEAVLGKVEDRGVAYAGDLSQFAGTYEGVGRGRATSATIASSAGSLTLELAAPNAQTEPLRYVGDDTFAFKDALVIFDRGAGGVTGLRLDTVGGYYPLHKR